MKRRVFFLKTGAAVSLLSIGAFAYWFTYDDPETGVLNPFIQDFLSEDDLSNIAKAYLNSEKKTPELKAQSLNKIRKQIKQDFIAHKTLICDGWVLSETEINYLIQKQHNEPDS